MSEEEGLSPPPPSIYISANKTGHIFDLLNMTLPFLYKMFVFINICMDS